MNKSKLIALLKTILQLCIISIITFCCLCGCSYHHTNKQKQVIHLTQLRQLSNFNALEVGGNAVIKLSQGLPHLAYSGQKEAIDNLDIHINNHTLFIHSDSTTPLTINLQANNLNMITVDDHARLVAQNITNNFATITAKHNGYITLNGNITVAQIIQNGDGKIDIRWINSKDLKILSNNSGPIYLSGVATNAEATLSNNARLEARFLRTKTATVYTTQQARADILATTTLTAYADNQSNILYYKRPINLNKVTRDSGNVLLIEELR